MTNVARTGPLVVDRRVTSLRTSLLGALVLASCSGDPIVPPPRDGGVVETPRDGGTRDAGEEDAGTIRDAGLRDGGALDELVVLVTLDGAPIEGATIKQGGADREWQTDADGRAIVDLDENAYGSLGIVASHPDARMRAADPVETTGFVQIDLERFDRSDNEAYPYGDPGEPTRRDSTAQCAHCHTTINEDWFASPHRTAAKNGRVHDAYAGAAEAFDSEASCLANGGRWREGLEPGTGQPAFRCYIGDGALEAVNPSCTEAPCEQTATNHADCADCHAPAIPGPLGGRDLLEATDFAYEYGVSCDTCHRVEQVDLAQPAGVAGRLRFLRPSEEGSIALGAGGFLPLTFGPSKDSPNPRMGGVPREHFREATLCAGCHEHETAPMRSGDTIDPARWPSGALPIQSTYSEWSDGPMSPSMPCQECHMPPAAERMNGADLQNLSDAVIGITGGWRRAPGEVREHAWYGPRQPSSRMLELAAAVFVAPRVNGGVLEADVTVKNVGAGHAIPTGEPMRTIVLAVEARCGDTPLPAIGGDAVPAFGGALATKDASGDWFDWPGAQIGDVVRVVRRVGGFHDYEGPLSFGDGTRTPAQRGLPIEDVAGSATITAVSGTSVTFDRTLPSGDVAYLVRGAAVPVEGAPAAMLAGAPGFAFARVLVDRDGRRSPHFVAVDVTSDNRLMPQASFTTTHRFTTSCADPVVHARLAYRSYPHSLARARGWSNPDQMMVEVRR